MAVLGGALGMALFFLLLMGDGRRLEERRRQAPFESGQYAQSREIPLFDENYALWTAHPFAREGDALTIEDVPAGRPGRKTPQTDEIFGPA